MSRLGSGSSYKVWVQVVIERYTETRTPGFGGYRDVVKWEPICIGESPNRIAATARGQVFCDRVVQTYADTTTIPTPITEEIP